MIKSSYDKTRERSCFYGRRLIVCNVGRRSRVDMPMGMARRREMTKFALGLDAGKRRWTGQWADVDVCKQ